MDNPLELSDPSAPIFIIGSPRSGTSVLALSLAKHSQLWSSGESYILFDLYGEGRADAAFQRAKELSGASWFNEQNVEKIEFLRCLGLGFNALFSSKTGGRRWIDHTPHYCLMVDTLAQMFPHALFLHILRDGRRVVHSMTHFRNVLGRESPGSVRIEGFAPEWTTDFTAACKAWSLCVETSMEFCSRHPERCLTVVNEEMIADTEKCFRNIFQFIGVSWEKDPVSHFSTYRINSSFQLDSSDPALVQRLFNPWSEWSPDQKSIFLKEAAPCLIKYGLACEDELVVKSEDANRFTDT